MSQPCYGIAATLPADRALSMSTVQLGAASLLRWEPGSGMSTNGCPLSATRTVGKVTRKFLLTGPSLGASIRQKSADFNSRRVYVHSTQAFQCARWRRAGRHLRRRQRRDRGRCFKRNVRGRHDRIGDLPQSHRHRFLHAGRRKRDRPAQRQGHIYGRPGRDVRRVDTDHQWQSHR